MFAALARRCVRVGVGVVVILLATVGQIGVGNCCYCLGRVAALNNSDWARKIAKLAHNLPAPARNVAVASRRR